ncbi:discoidin domain-containing protein [Anabaena sp. CCY 9402-a]|uniref:discoidin domain-containing protein n=1 Tax=Anabaena sp. CCY 9402-a TaxID=3103867 RepID=UPI0039C74C5A
MKINQFPESLDLSIDDLLIIWDTSTGTTKKISAASLLDWLSANIKVASNISGIGTATASSSFNASFLPIKATDGSTATDWASLNQTNPWIQIDFSSSKKVSQVKIADRIGQSARCNAGTLSFSDGSSVAVTGILNNGTYSIVEFATKTITWVRFTVTAGTGTNVGLSEFQIIGY